MSFVKTLERPRLSVKYQTLAAMIAVVAAVALPQLFHVVGAVSGLGTALGETFLPMHLPILLVGLLAGPYAGAVAGFASPLISALLTGMPRENMLPFMMVELCIYGLAAGLLRNVKLPVIAKLLIAQIAGRAVRAGVILFAVYVLGSQAIRVPIIWTSIAAGLPGLLLQWSLVPLLMYRIERGANREQ